MNKYIQSFYPYPLTFSSVGRTLPCRNASGELKNIAEFSESELEKLKNREPLFRELLKKKKIRILNQIPPSYVPPSAQINAANKKADALQTENAALRVRIAELEAAARAAAGEPSEEAAEEDSAEEPKRRRRKE